MSDLPDWTTIQTPSGDNLILDKLIQSARYPITQTISNYGGTANWVRAFRGNKLQAKYFPRGMRGAINGIEIYVKKTTAGNGTLIVCFAPDPAVAPDLTITLTIPANQPEAWGTFLNGGYNSLAGPGIDPAWAFNVWRYDSLFVWVDLINSSAGIDVAFDPGTPADEFEAASVGGIWGTASYTTPPVNRIWMRFQMLGMTVGDIPVSGSIQAVILPNETVKHGGLWLAGDYGAYAGKDFAVYGTIILNAGAQGQAINQAVPAGETWYITHWSADSIQTGAMVNNPWDAAINVAGSVVIVNASAYGGGFPFSKPYKATAGQVILFTGTNTGALQATFRATIAGYKG